MIELRRAYHDALLEFLHTQPGPRRVEAAYLWSEGSWDPLGVHELALPDKEIGERIRGHNRKTRKAEER